MSAYGIFPLLRDPKGLANTVGAAHTRVRHVAGVQGKTSCTLTTEALGRLQPVKAKPLRGCFASLDGFPAPSASVSFATPTEMERGQRATKSCILPLTPWNRPNTHRRGRWIGFATCPCGLASEWGLGQSPRAFFVFEVVRVDVTVQKSQKKMCILESLLLKTPQIWPISDPTPTLTGVSNQKTSVFASEYTKNNSQKLY